MKNIIYGIAIIILGIVITVSVLSITGVMNRDVEIQDALKESVEKSVDACTTRYGYTLDDDEQFVADLMVELSNAVENDSDIKIDVMGVDKDKGYMAIRVSEYYKTALGVPKVAMCETTAFYDRGNTDRNSGDFTITFIDDDGLFLGQQTLPKGKEIVAPVTPTKEGKIFAGWNTIVKSAIGDIVIVGDLIAIEDLGIVVSNATYQAVYV